MTDRELINEAIEASRHAYAPYSKRRVGAALECDDGTVVLGCTVENADLGVSMCAEQSAVCGAVARGRTDFRRIAIYSKESSDYLTPCGTCRQILSEFSPEMEVLCVRSDGRYVSYKLRHLLPAAPGRDRY